MRLPVSRGVAADGLPSSAARSALRAARGDGCGGGPLAGGEVGSGLPAGVQLVAARTEREAIEFATRLDVGSRRRPAIDEDLAPARPVSATEHRRWNQSRDGAYAYIRVGRSRSRPIARPFTNGMKRPLWMLARGTCHSALADARALLPVVDDFTRRT
jgi:hypothetical protein